MALSPRADKPTAATNLGGAAKKKKKKRCQLPVQLVRGTQFICPQFTWCEIGLPPAHPYTHLSAKASLSAAHVLISSLTSRFQKLIQSFSLWLQWPQEKDLMSPLISNRKVRTSSAAITHRTSALDISPQTLYGRCF